MLLDILRTDSSFFTSTRINTFEGGPVVTTVVVAGGPRLGDVEAGVVASLGGEAFSVITGGLACVGLSIGLAAKFRGFLRYDAEHPVP